ncbi:MAG: hypothetical protein MUP90_03080 [Gammaproteobacteria bacterium]|nr:hypothetical protein [Gammaproteobacteria bacterium]
MKKILVFVLIALLAGCGSPAQHRTSGIEESTLLVIRGETLVGVTVIIEPGLTRVIQEEDLTPYTFGILGSTDPEIQKLETVTFKVQSGPLKVTVSRGGSVLIAREMQFAAGQTRELRINK